MSIGVVASDLKIAVDLAVPSRSGLPGHVRIGHQACQMLPCQNAEARGRATLDSSFTCICNSKVPASFITYNLSNEKDSIDIAHHGGRRSDLPPRRKPLSEICRNNR
jgi:hypothetical protein